jgi:hypothetical protein
MRTHEGRHDVGALMDNHHNHTAVLAVLQLAPKKNPNNYFFIPGQIHRSDDVANDFVLDLADEVFEVDGHC